MVRGEREDQDLRQLFEELRGRDRAGTPAFEAVIAGARARAPRRPGVMVRLAAVLALLVVGAAAWAVLHRAPSRAQVAIADWRSPTEWLLRVPGVSFDSVSITASVINVDGSVNRAFPSSGRQKGDTI